MLRTALNAITRIHSRPATLKRLGTVDMYSPIRITPSNYSRFLRGPEFTTIPGVEFIIPVDSMTGQYAELLTFSAPPTSGTFVLNYGMNATTAIAFNATAADIQVALRLITGLGNVIVAGNFTSGFTITFAGFQNTPDLLSVTGSTLDTTTLVSRKNIPWSDLVKKADRILDGNKLLVIDEIVEMHDLGASVMAYRVRTE